MNKEETEVIYNEQSFLLDSDELIKHNVGKEIDVDFNGAYKIQFIKMSEFEFRSTGLGMNGGGHPINVGKNFYFKINKEVKKEIPLPKTDTWPPPLEYSNCCGAEIVSRGKCQTTGNYINQCSNCNRDWTIK